MIDSHAHVAYFENEAEREAVIARAREAGVSWIEIGTDLEQSRKALELSARLHQGYGARSPLLGTTVGVHPSDIAKGVNWTELESLMQGAAAVGEVGIDLHHGDNLDEQLVALGKFVQLAKKKNLPMVFHVRDGKEKSAHDEMIQFLREHWGASPAKSWRSGVIHTFSGSKEQAKQYLELGLYLSFSGVVTYKNAGEIAEVAASAPLEKILIETDCPYLTPEPFRGKQNEPSYVKYIAEKIANLRGISVEEVVRATEENAKKLFLL